MVLKPSFSSSDALLIILSSVFIFSLARDASTKASVLFFEMPFCRSHLGPAPFPRSPDFRRRLIRRPRHAPARQRAPVGGRGADGRMMGRMAPEVSSKNANSCSGYNYDPNFRENPGYS